jgi:hypothetical protein
MRRFYFHLRTGDELTPDEEGTDFPDFSAAQREALLCARELLSEAIKRGKSEVPEALVIADEAGRQLAIVPLTAVLPEPLKK